MLRKEFLIVDDDLIGCEILRQIVERQVGWKVVGVSHDGLSGIDMILDSNPDMVLLDLMMPRCDGFSVMKTVRKHRVDCKFLVVSTAQDTNVISHAMAAGASYFMTKPYDEEAIVERIDGILHSVEKQQPNGSLFFNDYQQWMAAVDNEIFDKFMTFGLPVKQQGFDFLRSAVNLCLRDPSRLRSVTSRLYPELAAGFRVSRDAVEHSMRIALETTWKCGEPQSFANYIGNETFLTVRPTIGEFLNLMSAKISIAFRYVGESESLAR